MRVTLFELTCLKLRYKNLISWANRRTKAAQEKLVVHWVHPFPSFKRMHREWQRLGKAQKLETTIHNGKVGVRWDLPHFFNYVATQKELMESMDFPMIDGEPLFVIIIRGDGFPCGSRPWVQIAIGFANHMEKARTLQYNWTLDVALTSEHDDEAMRVLFCATLQHIQTIIDSGYIQMDYVYYRARIMLGGDSPWLRLLLGLSPYYAIGNNPKVEHDAKENERPHVGDDAKEEGGPQDGMHEGGSERAMASTREKECADDGKEEVGPETQALWAVDSR